MKHITTFADFLNEKINVKDIKVGTILNYDSGETWKVTKIVGDKSNPRGVFAAPHGDTKKNYISLPLEFSVEDLENGVKSLSESVVNEAATFKTSDIAKTVSYLTAEVGVEPGYIFFGDGEDIEDFDKLWKKRKYQEALDMLANDREIVAKTFDDVKPWVKESVNEGFLDVNDGFWALYIANKDTTIGKTQVPKGTVIGSIGGGNWESTDGKIKTHIAALLDTPDFDKVQNPTWPKTVELTKEIEKWSRNTRDLIQNDPANAEKIISLRVKKIEDIRKMIK